MHLLEQFPILRSIPLFEIASKEHIRQCFGEQVPLPCKFSPGQIVYSSDTEGDRIGILISGEAEIHTIGGEARTLLKAAKAGQMFGVANLYAADAAFPTVIRAKTATEILFIEGDVFRAFIEGDPGVLRFYLEFLSKKIVYLNRKIATFTAGSAEHRLALFLLENQSEERFVPPYSMATLANLLGVGRASLYRAVDKLAEMSLVEHQNGCFRLLDPKALAAFCNPTSS